MDGDLGGYRAQGSDGLLCSRSQTGSRQRCSNLGGVGARALPVRDGQSLVAPPTFPGGPNSSPPANDRIHACYCLDNIDGVRVGEVLTRF
jgi:hypothetical protein